jgi:hypothetical protein
MPKVSKGSQRTTKVNKAVWIRSQPPGLLANELVAKAKAGGISLTAAQVYMTRSLANRRSGGTGRRSVGVGRPAANEEAAFRRFVLKLGLDRVEVMLES